MPTQAEYDAAFAAATPLVNAAIEEAEGQVPIFARRQAQQSVEQHRGEINASVKAILKAGLDAAEKVRTPA